MQRRFVIIAIVLVLLGGLAFVAHTVDLPGILQTLRTLVHGT